MNQFKVKSSLKSVIRFCIILVFFFSSFTGYSQNNIPVPSVPQLRWQNYERVMFLHFAPNTWTGGFSDDSNPLSINRLNPTKLNTDQWCKVAKSWGAKMIIFTSKHGGGFCWWQTNTTDYSVKNIPWKNGKGDVLAELAKSCDKYGLDMGIYIYPGSRSFGAGTGGLTKDTAKQEAYNKVFRQQLTEVLSKYKSMKEVWFDGGCEIGISDILEKFAADAVISQGPQATIRWVGNEKGIAPYPNWYTVKNKDLFIKSDYPPRNHQQGLVQSATALRSDPDGDVYAPIETDLPLLQNQKTWRWFWTPNSDSLLLSLSDLMNVYYKSVGRGSVLVLNASPDTTGLIPKSHVALYKAFGKEIDRRFNKPIASVSGTGNILVIDLHKPMTINHAIISEDISQGQRVREFVLEGFSNGKWTELKNGSSIGSKRIEVFLPAVKVSRIRLHITQTLATPVIQNFALYNITNDNSINMAVTLRDWDTQTFSTDWQDFSLDLTPYFVEKAEQFELKFLTIDADRKLSRGIEFKNWKIEINGIPIPNIINKTGDWTFLINNSHNINKETPPQVSFKTQIRTKPAKSIGTIELKIIK
jgi:alpha-L-fucosidase